MTATCQAWLPPLALLDGALADRLTASVRSWESKWFSHGKLASFRVGMGGSTQTAHIVRASECGGVLLSCGDDDLLALACLLLRLPRAPAKFKKEDLRLLRRVALECLDNLFAGGCEVAGNCVPGEREQAVFEQAELDVALSATLRVNGLARPIALHLSQDAAVRGRKALIGQPREPKPLQPRSAALDRQQITVSARVGWGEVGLAELHALEPNDVILLDIGPGEDLVLHVNGRPVCDPSLEIFQSGASLLLRTRAKR